MHQNKHPYTSGTGCLGCRPGLMARTDRHPIPRSRNLAVPISLSAMFYQENYNNLIIIIDAIDDPVIFYTIAILS